MAVKILSVDDELPLESLMRQYFRREIRSEKYEFFFAHNGREALDVLSEHPDIEIILSDINMPGMDGLTLLAKVNEMRNPLLRVVMVSAYGDMKNIRQAMNKGAFDFATKPIDKDDLQQTIDNAIAEIEHERQLQKEHTQLESLKTDLNGAREIQQYILPREFPPFPEVADKVDIYASMEAAKDIGGDFYDFFRLDDEHIAFTIADVCGKGIPAALFMAVSRTTIRSQAALHHDPAECLTESNKMLVSYSVDCMFVTVFYGIYNIKTGLVTYSNAGHNEPCVVRSNGEVEMIPRMKGSALGLIVRKPYLEDTLQLNPGDKLYMYTDGVNEAMNSSSEKFGNDRMMDILRGTQTMDCRQTVDCMREGIRNFVGDAEQSDDITMLALKREK